MEINLLVWPWLWAVTFASTFSTNSLYSLCWTTASHGLW